MLDFRGAIHCYEIILVYFPDILLGNAQKVSLILRSSRFEDFFLTDVSATYTAAIGFKPFCEKVVPSFYH